MTPDNRIAKVSQALLERKTEDESLSKEFPVGVLFENSIVC
ncbi:hypothetical protein HMPREF1549_02164, partial [Actinomyces johnsonii F0510]